MVIHVLTALKEHFRACVCVGGGVSGNNVCAQFIMPRQPSPFVGSQETLEHCFDIVAEAFSSMDAKLPTLVNTNSIHHKCLQEISFHITVQANI